MSNYNSTLLLCYFSISSTFFFFPCIANDIITPARPLRDGDTLVSAGGSFELGFFSPGTSGRRYIGIWYKKIPLRTIVWVANRENPILNSSSLLTLTVNSTLALVDGIGAVLWSVNSRKPVKNPVAQLLDSGNFVVRSGDEEYKSSLVCSVWQSFDHPSDIQLAGMKLGRDLTIGLDRYLTSWKSNDDPTPGSYTYRLDLRGYPQQVLMKGSVEQFRLGPWNGLRFSGGPNQKPNSFYKFWFVLNNKEIYYEYKILNKSVITHRVLNQYGTMQRLLWSDSAQGWVMYLTAQSDNCDMYALCGAFSSCNIANSPDCGCLKGFLPKNPFGWEVEDWSAGCVRRTELDCEGRSDGFIKYSNTKLPDTKYAWYDNNMSLKECHQMCLRNCSCVAYANLDVRVGGSGCLIWLHVIIDLKLYSENGQDIYVRMAASELGDEKRRVWIIVTSTLLSTLFVALIVAFYAWKKRGAHKKGRQNGDEVEKGTEKEGQKEEEGKLPSFEFSVIARATNNFSDETKLGEGGFGSVYKGTLNGGKEIAVKRQAKESKQGIKEFKNEAICIARLQHRNLIKLLGCCAESHECILVYEYLPNKSLDFFIFDKATLLEWKTRCRIIKGIARGLLYLHQDSRLRIIHRDLKASNILLDHDMTPKISDFGMARSFLGNESPAQTKQVVGTYGYMAPEYAIDGIFSRKSDVFSFGVLLLEIVSSKRNRGFNHPDHHHNLLGHAWKLFQKGEVLELAEPFLTNTSDMSQIQRSIHIGLLCVQQYPEDRPNMSSVVLMLDSEGDLIQPKQPGFYVGRNAIDNEPSSSASISYCSNDVTITAFSGR